jgi:hypothetical protein
MGLVRIINKQNNWPQEAVSWLQIVNKFLVFNGSDMFITMFTAAQH